MKNKQQRVEQIEIEIHEAQALMGAKFIQEQIDKKRVASYEEIINLFKPIDLTVFCMGLALKLQHNKEHVK